MVPLLAAYAPFALVIGATAADRGFALAGWSGSWLVYGGSAQLAAMRALDDAGPAVAILTGLVVNARLVVYSARLARVWPQQPRWFRLVAAGLIIDPTFATAERHAASCGDPRSQRRHFVAAGLTLGAGWSLAMAVGALAGARVDGLDLDIVVPLCLLSLVGDALRPIATRRVVLVAAGVAAITITLPAGTGLLAAVAAGTAAGSMTRREQP
jgi:predicted branched-subunit amino acid permease